MGNGTAFLVMSHPTDNWLDDERRYAFLPYEVGGVEIEVRKPEPRRLWITMTGVTQEPFMVNVSVPVGIPGAKFNMSIRWQDEAIDMTINGDAVPSSVGPVGDFYVPPVERRNVVRPEEVYLKKVEEMQVRAKLDTYFDLIIAAATLRHLLVDGNRLVDQLTRTRPNLKPMFEVLMPKQIDLDLKDIAGIEAEVEWTCIDPDTASKADPLRTKVKLQRFLALRCLAFRGSNYAVLDIISSCANIRGGVHFGTPDAVQQSLIDLDEVARIGGTEVSVKCIGLIVSVALRGLEPLTQAIRKELNT